MNVLSKIVIPKTNVTSMYIISELEEFAREEFFRLKKILEIKRKMFGEVKEEKKESVMCTTCDPVREWSVIERCIMCKALLIPVSEKTEESEKLEEFKTHLSEIVNTTKDMDKQGFIAASVEDFIRTAEMLQEKLEQKSESKESSETGKESYDEKLGKLCGKCRKKYLLEKASKAKIEEPEPEKIEVVKLDSENSSLIPPQESKATIKVAIQPLVSLTPPQESKATIKVAIQPLVSEPLDLELGTFETEIQEITKVIRVKKEDGSITEEKQVIRVRKEVRTPLRVKNIPPPNPVNQDPVGRITYQSSSASGTSSKTNPYSGSKTVGVITSKSLDYFQRCPKYDIITKKARSEMLSLPPPMSDPVARYCMSSVTLLSVDFGEYSPSFVESYIDYEE